ncbi:WecB/TagA/CpsF family glycosyltransferase, partial [Patescibacteria group bacterium]|nr:WecB/TagA/CpsF family glycosyltransferase [Patescibacteria group bacterium]
DFLPRLPSVKIAVGVGGVFAFLSGQIKRAPKIFQQLGIEWLWRLIKEPNRLGRIFTAVIIFPIMFFWDKIKPSVKQ